MKSKLLVYIIVGLLSVACSNPPEPMPSVSVDEGWDGWRMEGADSAKSATTPHESPASWHHGHYMTSLLKDPNYHPSGEHSTPLVLGDAIVAASSSGWVVAMTWNGEQLIWKSEVKGSVFAGLAYNGGRLFVADDEGHLTALDLEGKELWSFKADYPVIASPIADDGKVYLLTMSQEIFCLDAATGAPRWSYSSKIASDGTLWRGTSLALGGGKLYAGLAEGRVVALDASLGTLEWKERISDKKRFPDAAVGPIFDGGIIYAGSRHGLYALDAASGDKLWSKPYSAVGGIVSGEDKLYFGTGEGGFAAVNSADGELLWSTALDGGVSAAPVLAGAEVLVGATRGGLVALSAVDGKIVKSYRPGTGINARPWAGEQGVAFISNGGVLHRFTR